MVSAAKFGSKQGGTRSAPPFRLMRGVTDKPFEEGRDIFEAMNHQAAIMIQIESLAGKFALCEARHLSVADLIRHSGINNLDAILTEVPDIDIVWLGTLDLRVEMNLPSNAGRGGSEPEWLAARKKFFDVMDKHDKPYGGFAFAIPPFGTPESFKEAVQRMSFVIQAADVAALASMGDMLKVSRELAAPAADKKVNGESGRAVNGESGHAVNGEKA